MLLGVLLLRTYVCVGLSIVGTSALKLNTAHEWKYVDFLWENEMTRAQAIQSGDYDPAKVVIVDSDVAKDGRVFVTVIRGKGVPASLTTISDYSGSGGPLLKPYPDWSWTRKCDCMGITNVYRIAIDKCNRLWVVDNGNIGGNQVCPPELFAFNLTDNRLLRRITLPVETNPSNLMTGRGLFVTPVVETNGVKCSTTHVYIADVHGYGLVVYNGKSVWRLNGTVYEPQNSAADIEMADQYLNQTNGLLGMAISPEVLIGRYLTFSAHASYDVFRVNTHQLHDHSEFGNNPQYIRDYGVLPDQAGVMAFASTGVLFFGFDKAPGLGCWNMFTATKGLIIDATDEDYPEQLFTSGLKILPSRTPGGNEQIWMVMNNQLQASLGTQNLSEINYRILTGNVNEILRRTRCQSLSFLTFSE